MCHLLGRDVNGSRIFFLEFKLFALLFSTWNCIYYFYDFELCDGVRIAFFDIIFGDINLEQK